MHKTILVILLVFASGSVMAEWVISTVSESEKVKFYIKPSSIQKSGNTVKIWVLADYNEVQKKNIGEAYLSYMDQYEIKCKEKQKRSIYQVVYAENMGKGNIVWTFDEPGKWKPAIPDSVDEYLIEFACNK